MKFYFYYFFYLFILFFIYLFFFCIFLYFFGGGHCLLFSNIQMLSFDFFVVFVLLGMMVGLEIL